MDDEMTCSTTLMLRDGLGWHLRPAALLAKLAHMFDSEILAERGKRSVSARSLFGIVMLCASGGKHLRVTARGRDAKDAIKAIETGFAASVQSVAPAKASGPPPAESGGWAQPGDKKAATKGAAMTETKTGVKLTGRKKVAAITFTCSASPAAKKVFVAGDFNGWDPHADALAKRNGHFVKSIQLAPGEHQYKYVIDGEWHVDPSAPTVVTQLGTLNNVVCV